MAAAMQSLAAFTIALANLLEKVRRVQETDRRRLVAQRGLQMTAGGSCLSRPWHIPLPLAGRTGHFAPVPINPNYAPGCPDADQGQGNGRAEDFVAKTL